MTASLLVGVIVVGATSNSDSVTQPRERTIAEIVSATSVLVVKTTTPVAGQGRHADRVIETGALRG